MCFPYTQAFVCDIDDFRRDFIRECIQLEGIFELEQRTHTNTQRQKPHAHTQTNKTKRTERRTHQGVSVVLKRLFEIRCGTAIARETTNEPDKQTNEQTLERTNK